MKDEQEVTEVVIHLIKPYQDQCKTVIFVNGGVFVSRAKAHLKKLGCDVYFGNPVTLGRGV